MFADITSANVVGYKAEALREGFTMMTPCFVNVADAKVGVDLLELIPGGEYGSGDIVVETLTPGGLADKTYTYTKPRKGDWVWLNDDDEAVSEGEVMFDNGTGLWIQGVDGISLTSAGAVSTADTVIALTDGFVACGNMTPVAIDLTSIIPGGDYASGDIVIETLTAGGLADKTYTFTKPRKGDWVWLNDDDEPVAEGEVTFPAGAGLWVQGVEGATLTIPGPALK